MFFNYTACTEQGGKGCATGGELDVPALGQALTLPDMALVVSAMDFICSCVFIGFVTWMWTAAQHEVSSNDMDNVTPADYTVFVQGLPTDVTREQVVQHFNSLYDLFKEDRVHRPCCRQPYKRPTMAEETPEALEKILLKNPAGFGYQGAAFKRTTAASVKQALYSDKPELFEGTFIANVELVYPIGALVRRISRLEKLHARLAHAKAEVDRLQEQGKSASRVEKLKASVKKMEAGLAKLQQKAVAAKGTDVLGAFVTFNNEESFRRCMDDFKGSDTWCGRRAQERALRWQQVHALQVTQAPEPSNIIWEHLEVTPSERFLRQSFSNCLMLVLLLVSFAVILSAKSQEAAFRKDVPSAAVCNAELPASAFGAYDAIPGKWRYTRGDPDLQAQCSAVVPGTETMWIVDESSGTVPPANFSSLCHSPCVKPSDSAAVCETIDGKSAFAPNARIGCYCLQQLVTLVQEEGLQDGPRTLVDTEGSLCTDFAEGYISLQGIVVAATLVVVIINFVLTMLLTRATKYERHMTVSAETVAIANKIFTAQVLNSAVIFVLVNASLPGLSYVGLSWLSELGVFSGDFSSFSKGWYAAVGASIAFTQVLDIFIPHIFPVLQALILFPYQRRSSQKAAVSQAELNEAYTPPPLDIGKRYPVMLKAIFVCMLFSSGMPILYVITAVHLWVMYLLEKGLMLYFYSRPPALDEHIALDALRGMPVAVLLHLALAVWMFGDPETTESTTVLAEVLERGVETPYPEVNHLMQNDQQDLAEQVLYDRFREESSSYDPGGLLPRIVRSNTLPSFILLLLLVLLLLLRQLGVLQLLLKVLHSVFKLVTCNFACAPCLRHEPPLADEGNPPYAGKFYHLMPPKANVHLSPDEKAQGWMVVPDTIRGGNLKMRVRVWMEEGDAYGMHHEQGDAMHTFEVMGDVMVHSYSIHDNPKYMEVARVVHLSPEALQAHVAAIGKGGAGSADAASQGESTPAEVNEDEMAAWLAGTDDAEAPGGKPETASEVPRPEDEAAEQVPSM